MSDRNFFLLLAITIVVLIVIIVTNSYRHMEGVEILTDRTEYKIGDPLKVKIENKGDDKLCFSSCYPYYIEKKNGGWKSYNYIACSQDNKVERCIDPKEVKAFELTVPPIEKGEHRLAIPACVGCQIQEEFESDKWFYSNEFKINF